MTYDPQTAMAAEMSGNSEWFAANPAPIRGHYPEPKGNGDCFACGAQELGDSPHTEDVDGFYCSPCLMALAARPMA